MWTGRTLDAARRLFDHQLGVDALTLDFNILAGLNAALVGANAVLFGSGRLDLEGHRLGVGVVDEQRTLDDLGQRAWLRQRFCWHFGWEVASLAATGRRMTTSHAVNTGCGVMTGRAIATSPHSLEYPDATVIGDGEASNTVRALPHLPDIAAGIPATSAAFQIQPIPSFGTVTCLARAVSPCRER